MAAVAIDTTRNNFNDGQKVEQLPVINRVDYIEHVLKEVVDYINGMGADIEFTVIDSGKKTKLFRTTQQKTETRNSPPIPRQLSAKDEKLVQRRASTVGKASAEIHHRRQLSKTEFSSESSSFHHTPLIETPTHRNNEATLPSPTALSRHSHRHHHVGRPLSQNFSLRPVPEPASTSITRSTSALAISSRVSKSGPTQHAGGSVKAVTKERHPSVKSLPAMMDMMEKEHISKEQLQKHRDFLTDLLNDKEKCKSLEDFAQGMGTGKHTLIVAWRILRSYENFMNAKATQPVLKAHAESMWNAVAEVVVLPEEIHRYIDSKLLSGDFDNKVFELPKHYIETVIALFILPKYAEEKNISLGDYINRKSRNELRKDKSLRMITPKVRAKKTKEKKKPIKLPTTQSKEKKERIQRYNKNIDRQVEAIHTYVCQIKDALGKFDSFVDQAQSWADKCTDEEQLRQCDKALNVSQTEIERTFARIQDKFDKMKALYPFATPSEQSVRSAEPLSVRDSNSHNNNTAGPTEKVVIQRKSSIVAERLWAELCKEEEKENQFLPAIKFSDNLTQEIKVNSKAKTPVNEVLKPKPGKLNRTYSSAQLLVQPLICYDSDFVTQSLVEEPEDAAASTLESHQVTPHFFSDGEESSMDDIDQILNQKIEEMDDDAFDTLLEDIVITSPRVEGERETKSVEFLQNWFERLKLQYGEALGIDDDEIF
jgi:hypothetical protein